MDNKTAETDLNDVKIPFVTIVLKYCVQGKVGLVTAEEKTYMAEEIFSPGAEKDYARLRSSLFRNVRHTLDKAKHKTLSVALLSTEALMLSLCYETMQDFNDGKIAIRFYENGDIEKLSLPVTSVTLDWVKARVLISKILAKGDVAYAVSCMRKSDKRNRLKKEGK